jgi:hypothetical protein
MACLLGACGVPSRRPRWPCSAWPAGTWTIIPSASSATPPRRGPARPANDGPPPRRSPRPMATWNCRSARARSRCLDFWHAAGHLGEGAKAVWGPGGGEAEAALDRGKKKLLEDGYCGVGRRLGVEDPGRRRGVGAGAERFRGAPDAGELCAAAASGAIDRERSGGGLDQAIAEREDEADGGLVGRSSMSPPWWNWGLWPPGPNGRRSGSRNDPMPKSSCFDDGWGMARSLTPIAVQDEAIIEERAGPDARLGSPCA